MARAAPLLTSFNAGEWDPELWGSVDLAKYPNACRKLQNFIGQVRRTARRRIGTHFVAPTRGTPEKIARLIPFEFSVLQAYQIEATDLAFRFYKDRARIESPPGTPVEIATPYAEALLPTLKWTQSADTLYLVQPTLQQRLLTRSSHIAWTLSLFDFLDGPYLEVNLTATTLTPSATSGAITITASAAAGINGGAGFLSTDVGRLVRIKHGSTWGNAKITAFTDTTHVSATVKSAFGAATAQASWRLGAWSDTTGWPAAVGFHEERLWFGYTTSQPSTIWGSKSGDFPNFAPTETDGTVLADSAVTYTIADALVNAVRAFVPGDTLIVLTNSGPFEVKASSLAEAITPTNIKVTRIGSVGAADQPGLRIGAGTLYVERSTTQLYELAFRFELGESGAYAAPELTELARHLSAPGLAAIAWQQNPHKALWAARSDGVLLGMTYSREQDVVGWHRHPLGGGHVDSAGVAQSFGKVLSLSVIPGTIQDELWLVVERTIDGATRRYVEFVEYEFRPRNVDDKDGAWYVDCGLSYNGAQAVTLTPGAGATIKGQAGVPFTAGAALFAAGDVGREIHHSFDTAQGDGSTRTTRARAAVTGFVSAFEVTATILVPFPSTAAIPANLWALTATTISGADHLEGQTVQVLADGAAHPDRVVTAGAIALDRPAARVQVGLGYHSHLESMNLEGLGRLAGLKRIVKAAVKLLDTLGCRLGYDDAHLEEIPFRRAADPMDESPPLFTGDKLVEFPKGFEREARVHVVQEQPLPCTICALGLDVESNNG